MLGYEPDDLPHTSDLWYHLIHPDDQAAVLQLWRTATDGGGARFESEFRMRTKSGAWKWILSRARAVEWDEKGRAVRFVGTHIDMTGRKRMEAHVAAREREQRTILASLPDFIFLHDREGVCVECFAQGIADPPAEPDALLGRDVRDVLPAAAAAFVAEVLRASRVGDAPRTRTYETEGSQGRRFYEARSVRYSRDRFIHIIREVTEARQAEEEMQRIRERLHQAEKLHAVGQLAGGIAHDFNNQMAGIIFLGELLKKSVLDPEKIARYADMMIRRAKGSAALTEKLLTFARKSRAETHRFDVHNVLRDVIAFLEHTVDKKISICVRLEASQSMMIGDVGQIENAILNVALNARDAMPDGGELTISTSVVSLGPDSSIETTPPCAPGAYVCVAVSDTGMGMDAETVRHVCEPFFTTKGPGQGYGLGLASMHGTVSSHGGGYHVRSRLGAGTLFCVYFPLACSSSSVPEESEGAHVASGSGHILVVDDEEVFRTMTAEVLRDLGYEVTTCEDGLSAVELYRRNWRDIEVVLLDMVMPRMDGKETFEAIRRINPAANVVLITGRVMSHKAEALLGSGVRGFVKKPFLLSELSDALVNAVQH
jgi:PAS domain S-box-containing protein